MTTEQIVDFFEYAYEEITGQGRGERLFGKQNREILAAAFRVGILPCPYPTVYWEFPLGGTPYLDILVSGCNRMLSQYPYRYEDKRWQEMPFAGTFRFLADSFSEIFPFGTTWDLSAFPGELPQPGFYTANMQSDWLVRGALECLGRKDGIRAAVNILNCTPLGWYKYFLGMMPQRPNSPIRFGWRVQRDKLAEYRENPRNFGKDLRQLGYLDFDEEMLAEICNPVYAADCIEVQLDLLPKGILASDLGIYFMYDAVRDMENRKFTFSPLTRNMFLHLQDLHLADERWQLLLDCFGSSKFLSFADNTVVRGYIITKPNFVKVKWRNRQPLLSKVYLELNIIEH